LEGKWTNLFRALWLKHLMILHLSDS
jgi:hypothetical protein